MRGRRTPGQPLGACSVVPKAYVVTPDEGVSLEAASVVLIREAALNIPRRM